MSPVSPSTDARAGPDTDHDGLAALRPAKLVLATDVHIGQALRQARERLDLGLEDIAQATHVRATFIDALERLDLEPLPAGPFAVGYVKAYARALGLEPDAVVARFKREMPVEDTKLGAPFGGQFKRGARFSGLAAAALVVVAGLAGWNLVVRAKSPGARAVASAPPVAVHAPTDSGPSMLGAPLPAPPEASTPAPYETPGLAEATAAKGPDAAAAVTAQIAEEAAKARPGEPVAAGAQFSAHGAVYGAPRAEAGVVLQAVRPMSLVVRGAGGAVYFARQLAPGEAWRAPNVAGLTVDVDVPTAVEVYVQGHAVGLLSQAQTPLTSLTTPKTPPT